MRKWTDEELARAAEFDSVMRGLTGPQIGRGVTEYLIPGVNYKQMSNARLRDEWATRQPTLNKKRLSDFTLAQIREAAVLYQGHLDEQNRMKASRQLDRAVAAESKQFKLGFTREQLDALHLVMQHVAATTRHREGSKLDKAMKLLAGFLK